MKIRLAQYSDILKMSRIVKDNYSPYYEKMAYKDILLMFSDALYRPLYVVAEENKTIIGFAGCIQSFMDYNIYEICWVNVSSEFQNKGIGTKLVSYLIQRLKKIKGVQRAHLVTLSTHYPSFYEKLGFQSVFNPKDYHLMVLKLVN